MLYAWVPDPKSRPLKSLSCSDNEKVAEITHVNNQEMEARISVAIEAVAADLRYRYDYGVVKLDGWLLM